MFRDSANFFCFRKKLNVYRRLASLRKQFLQLSDDVFKQSVEIYDAIRLRGIAQYYDNEVTRWYDEDFLAIVTLTGVQVFGGIWVCAVMIKPEEGPVSSLAVRSGSNRIVDPPLRQDPASAHNAIVQEHLTEAGIVTCSYVQI